LKASTFFGLIFYDAHISDAGVQSAINSITTPSVFVKHVVR
jgi:hypothetical protein